MKKGRKYVFDWDSVIGDVIAARKGLGPYTRVEVYRLFQFTLRDVLEELYGTEQCDALFRLAGLKAGQAFYRQFLSKAVAFPDLIRLAQELFKEMGIGILRVEKSDEKNLHFVLTVDEDLDCSGMADINDGICIYDEGFIQGILQEFTGCSFDVREVDCWCTGKRTCRFEAQGYK